MSDRYRKKPENKRVKTWRVSHPEHGECFVSGNKRELAIIEAAKLWGVPWTKIAAYCGTVCVGQAYECKCTQCGKVFPSEKSSGLCPPCARIREKQYAQFAARHPQVDRRQFARN